MKTHLKDRHAGKWNKFSIFVIRRIKYLKDLETLILRIVPKAKGIKIKGRMPHQHALRRELRKIVKEYRRTTEQIEKTSEILIPPPSPRTPTPIISVSFLFLIFQFFSAKHLLH